MRNRAELRDLHVRIPHLLLDETGVQDDLGRMLKHATLLPNQRVGNQFRELRIVNRIREAIAARRLVANLQRHVDPQLLRNNTLIRQVADDAFHYESVQFQSHGHIIPFYGDPSTNPLLYFPTANGKDSSEVGKMRICEGMKKPRAGELQGA